MKERYRWIALLAMSVLLFQNYVSAQQRVYRVPQFAKEWGKPGPHPDHIVLNLPQDPSTSMSVTWRTDTTVADAYAEIALATPAPKFWRRAVTLKAETERMDARNVRHAEVVSHYHSTTFKGLYPDTLYAYRVGDGKIWSEWIQFKTAAREPKPFSFLYVGDAQNFILELWSRLIREGYRKAPDARFIIHAGDLVNTAHSERQWHEWFVAGGWIHRMLPSLPIVGNHEYEPFRRSAESDTTEYLSVQWKPQFTLPPNGPEGLKETVYYVDYQDVRIIGLNSMEKLDTQAVWLEQVLRDNPNTWTVVTLHHPVFSATAKRDNKKLRALWKPLFDKYGVDIALQGHDHSYARGQEEFSSENVLNGLNTRDSTGTVYVVSVSGGKMYDLKPNGWEEYGAVRERGAENTQLFQVIHVDGNRLSYEAYTATGHLYDAFDLLKSKDTGVNRLVERKQEAGPARRFDNTVPYEDPLPEAIRKKLLRQFRGYQVNQVRYVDEPEFRGYLVELLKEKRAIYLRLSEAGVIFGKKEKN